MHDNYGAPKIFNAAASKQQDVCTVSTVNKTNVTRHSLGVRNCSVGGSEDGKDDERFYSVTK